MSKVKTWTSQQLIQFGYNHKLYYLNDLVNIWNIISDNYEFADGYLILPTEILNKVDDFIITNKLDKKFTKQWYNYKNNLPMHRGVLSIEEYTKKIAKEKEKERLRKIKEQEQQLQTELNYKEDLQTLEMLKGIYKNSWLNSDWIKAMIGTYDNPFAEYYWTLIGRNGYKVIDWKHNLSIREDIYNKIYNDKTFKSYSGRRFLNNSFKNQKGYAAYIKDTFVYITADESGYGIYGIYYMENESIEPELIYIGMTQKGFSSRWEEHMQIFKGEIPAPSGMILYQQKLDPDKIRFSKLINVNELNYEGSIGLQDLKAMELSCITLLAPKYNVLGVNKPYIL